MLKYKGDYETTTQHTIKYQGYDRAFGHHSFTRVGASMNALDMHDEINALIRGSFFCDHPEDRIDYESDSMPICMDCGDPIYTEADYDAMAQDERMRDAGEIA